MDEGVSANLAGSHAKPIIAAPRIGHHRLPSGSGDTDWSGSVVGPLSYLHGTDHAAIDFEHFGSAAIGPMARHAVWDLFWLSGSGQLRHDAFRRDWAAAQRLLRMVGHFGHDADLLDTGQRGRMDGYMAVYPRAFQMEQDAPWPVSLSTGFDKSATRQLAAASDLHHHDNGRAENHDEYDWQEEQDHGYG